MTRIADREVNVEAVLTALGVDERGRRGEWIDALCPLHVESNPSFAVSAEHGGWICNHEHLTGGLLDLVAAVRNCSRGEAARWISTQQSAPPSVDTLRERLLGKAIEIPNDDELTQWITRFAGLPIGTLPEYWFDRGFTWAAADAFDVRFDAGPPPALVWPVRDEQANIVGFIERKLPGASGPKYEYPLGFKKVLFPLDHFKGEEATLVEGPLDALWLHQHGYNGGLAMLGTGLTRLQAAWLRSHVRSVVIALDNDDAGNLALRRLAAQLTGLSLRIAQLPSGTDPQELPFVELAQILANARSLESIILMGANK